MEKDNICIRIALPDDAAQIQNIYEPYVTKTAITFEYDLPDVGEFQERMRKTKEKYPYIVAEEDGKILGYAYTGPFVGRAAYGWAAEVSIYLKENKRKMGLGRRLYRALEEISKMQHILNLNACIGYPETEDEYLTKNSVEFHAHMGYRMVGKFHKCGYKFGRWYDMVWMEKMLGAHPASPLPVVLFPDIRAEDLREIGVK